MPLALLALAISAFAIGTTEFVIMGLLPEVADAFGTSIPTAGLLISGYALGVAVGAPILTALTTRQPRKRVLIGLMVLFVIGNAMSAVAPTYGWMLAGRLIASLNHGAFFGIGAVVAAGLVPPERRASAVALMFTGLTVANVVGVPFGTWLGQLAGWRATFWAVAGLGLVSIAGIAALLPAAPAPAEADLRRELATFKAPGVWLALGMTALGFGGVFAAFTYIAPMMTQVAGFAPSALTPLLLLFGVGMVIGNAVGGKLADRALLPSLRAILAALAASLAIFTFTAHQPVAAAITIFVLGFVGFATAAPLQTWVMRQAEAAPTLASAANIGAFNVGNALGAWLGGLAIGAGFGYTSASWVGAALAAGSLALTMLAASPAPALARKEQHP